MTLQTSALPGTIRITVPWDPGLTSQNQRRHWSGNAALNATARQTASWHWVAAGRPRAEGRVRVSVIRRAARGMDQANLWGGLKSVMDGLFVRAITPDDSERWVELGSVSQSIGAEWKGREEVEFFIEPATPADGGRR